MFCNHCGANLQDGTKFCIMCGKAIAPASAVGAAQNKPAAQGTQSISGAANAAPGNAAGALGKTSGLAAKTGLSTGAIVGIGIACGVVLVLSVASVAGIIRRNNRFGSVQQSAQQEESHTEEQEEIDDYQARYDAKYQESLDRRSYFLAKVEAMRTEGLFPLYGRVDQSLTKEENYLLFKDIDKDGREELIVCLQASPSSTDWDYYIFDVNDIYADDIYVEYNDDASSTFFLETNYISCEPNLHGTDSVINYYKYNPNTDTYEYCPTAPEDLSELGQGYINVYKYSFQDDFDTILYDGLDSFVSSVVPR